MKRAVAAGLLAIASAVAPLGVHANAADPNAYTKAERYIPSGDGTMLQIRVYRPLHPKGRTPVIMNASPYNGSGGAFGVPPPLPTGQGIPDAGSFARSEHVFARGYSVVDLELRGYGGSGGCYDWGGPGEQSDVKAGVEWAARQSWSSGKVGMIGHSYDGWAGLAAIKTKPNGLAAVITESPPNGYPNNFSYGVRNFGGGTLFGAYYAASDLWPPSIFAPAQEWETALGGSARDPTCYARVVAGSYIPDPHAPYWVDRDVASGLLTTKVPTLLVQGFNDYNVRPTNAIPEFSKMRGPKQAILGPWWHGYSQIGSRFRDREITFFDRWLNGMDVSTGPTVLVQDASGRWRSEDDWPPHDARPWTMRLRPGSYLNAPGNNSETWIADAFPVSQSFDLPTGRGSWTFTQPLPHAIRTAGAATLRATISTPLPDVNLIGLVYDVDPHGNAAFVERGALRAAGSGTYSFDLYPQDWVFAPGHRIGVLLTGADDTWFEPSGRPVTVTVRSSSMTFGALEHVRTTTTVGPLEPRRPYPPFSVATKIGEATLVQPLPPRMR